MVKRICAKKIFCSAITVFVVADFLLGSFASAKQLKIQAEDVEKIKTVLSMTQTLANISGLIVHDKDLLTVLNTAIKGGETGADATYGLLVLSALNEMELIDLVISQEYKTKAREYFSQVLKDKTDLISHWKGIGYDLPKILSGYIAGPMAALTLNSFAITDKTIAVFVEFNVLEKMKLYDGLWYYFDMRKQGNEPHKIAWEETKEVLGFAASKPFRFGKKDINQDLNQLEQQFLSLYNNWSPYITAFGISEKYKKQVKEELNGVLIAAAKENAVLTKNKLKPSLVDKLTQQLEKLKEAAAALMSRMNPFKAGLTLNLPEEPEIAETAEITKLTISPQELIEASPQSIEPRPITTTTKTTATATTTTTEPTATAEPTTVMEPATTTEPVTEPEPAPEPELPPAPTAKPESAPEPVFCARDSGNPARFRVLINKVAWMGTANSANDEWIELKNIWGIPVGLSGWQLLDKDRQIKIIFGENDIIPAGGYYLLERTDDNSAPEAPADLIYTGALGNTDEALYLFDDQCNIEDEVLAGPDWPAGDNSLKKPMERLDVLNWYSRGSPPAARIAASVPAPVTAPSPASIRIFITETYIGSESNEKDDFVELYNPNSEAVDLTDWYLQRKTAGGQDFSSYVAHELLAGKVIGAKDYFLIANASSTFATSADVVTAHPLTENNALVLKNNRQEIINQVSTDDPSLGKSYGRKWSSSTLDYTEDFEAQTPTPRAQNQNSEPAQENEEEENSLPVTINEIAWAGTEANHSDEWLELLVNSTTTLDGWKILAVQNGTTTIEIPLAGFASSSTYILIERTDDNTISDIPADFFFTGNLDNDGMKLELRNPDGALADSVDCSSNWFAGDNSTKQTMERIDPLTGSDAANWASNNLITKNGFDADGHSVNGTPKAENSVAKDYTILEGGIAFNEDFTLKKLGSPYITDGPINVASGTTLSIEPGVIIKLKHGSSRTPYAELKVEGSLEALGGDERDEKIVFTSYKDDEYGGDTNNDGGVTMPTAGDWDWIYLKDSVANLQNVIVRYGGKLHSSCCGEFPSYTYGAIYIDGGQLTMNGSLVEKSETLGLWIKNASTTQINETEFKDIDTAWPKPAAIYIENGSPAISDSVFQDNNIGILTENLASPAIENNVFEGNQIPIQISALLPKISDSTVNNNSYNGIYLTGLALPEEQTSMTWEKTNIPYIVNTLNLASGLTLKIEPGTVIKFLSSGRLDIEGNFEADGTADDKIVLTSIQDDEYGGDANNDGAATQPAAGRWQYISFAASSSNAILENTVVRYGGWYNVFEGGADAKSGAVKTKDAFLTIRNSLFENNLFAGLEIVNATTTIENTAFNKNEYGIYIENDAGECPDLSGAAFGEDENANTTANIYPPECE